MWAPESDPQQATALDADTVCSALTLLRAEGYALLSLSGGEPLVYPLLRNVVRFAKGLGFRVTMISNGLLVNPRHDVLLDWLDGVAISFDGLEVTHNNHWRGRVDAFKRACAAVRHLTERGRHVAAAISLTCDAMTELPELADLLVELGATALQIRPVARAGQARSLTESVFYSPADQLRLHLVARALQQELPGVRVHCDLAPVQGLWQQRDAYAGLLGGCDEQDFSGAAAHSTASARRRCSPLGCDDSVAVSPTAPFEKVIFISQPAFCSGCSALAPEPEGVRSTPATGWKREDQAGLVKRPTGRHFAMPKVSTVARQQIATIRCGGQPAGRPRLPFNLKSRTFNNAPERDKCLKGLLPNCQLPGTAMNSRFRS